MASVLASSIIAPVYTSLVPPVALMYFAIFSSSSPFLNIFFCAAVTGLCALSNLSEYCWEYLSPRCASVDAFAIWESLFEKLTSSNISLTSSLEVVCSNIGTIFLINSSLSSGVISFLPVSQLSLLTIFLILSIMLPSIVLAFTHLPDASLVPTNSFRFFPIESPSPILNCEFLSCKLKSLITASSSAEPCTLPTNSLRVSIVNSPESISLFIFSIL